MGSKKSLFLWSNGSGKNRLFTADVQNDDHSPSRMHAVVLSIDQRPCRWCSAECSRDAITVTWQTRHFRYVTSEQNKVSKSKVVEKVKHVVEFECLLMTCAKNYFKNRWMCVKAIIASQIWDIFWDTVYSHLLSLNLGLKSSLRLDQIADRKSSLVLFLYTYVKLWSKNSK